LSLSDATIRNAKPSGKPYKLFDSGGLFLLVQPSGSKWWRYKYRFEGKEKLLALGSYPDVGLGDAREKHSQARKLVAGGKDPSQERKEAKRLIVQKNQNTFEAVAREWHQSRLQKWTPTHATKILKRLELNAFPKLGSRPIADVTASELLDVLRIVEDRGAMELAHRLLQSCGQVFTYALVTQRIARNPASDLRGALQPVKKKNRAFLKPEEMPEFLKRLDNFDGELQTKLAFKFLLLTFVRTKELRGAEWKEINFKKAEWRIPAERMKMRDPHIVPLSKQALSVLREVKKLTGTFRFIFPNQHKPAGCMSENTLLFALYRMHYHSRATVHGFRSTASTVLNEHGFRPDIIERQLAHCERDKVRAAYNHAQYLPERRKMMQWWADYLDTAAKRKVPRATP
jgi:integrase